MERESTLSKIENVEVQICVGRESSGNIQFFLRAVRTDDKSMMSLDGCLEYQCFQTQHQPMEQCIDYAIFGSEFLTRFFGLEKTAIRLRGFDEEMTKIAEKSIEHWLT